MKNCYTLLSSSPLFSGVGNDSFNALLKCLGAKEKAYKKGEVIFLEGDLVFDIGLLVSGRLHLVKSDIWGNNSLVAEIIPPGMFAEAIVCSGLGSAPVSVIAKEDSEVLFLDYKKIVTSCSSTCAFHVKLIRNMIGILARKNILLTTKLEHITKRTTKEKLFSYLSDQARQNNNKVFDIPYNRQELADYLGVERSALSAEMSKLKAARIISFKKNHFELLREKTI